MILPFHTKCYKSKGTGINDQERRGVGGINTKWKHDAYLCGEMFLKFTAKSAPCGLLNSDHFS